MKRRRRQPTKQRQSKTLAIAGDAPTKEWRQHFDVVVEDRDVKGTKGVRALAQTSFDRYYRRGLLFPGNRQKNAILYEAGEQFRLDWELSGLDLMARPSLERASRGSEDFTVTRLDALSRVQSGMRAMGAAASVVVDCAVYGKPVGRDLISVLRVGLKTLVGNYVDN